MKNKYSIKLIVFVGLTCIIVPALAILQYLWIGDITKLEKEHLGRLLENGGSQFSWDFSQEMIAVQKHFSFVYNPDSGKSFDDELKARLISWKNGKRGDLIRSLEYFDEEDKDSSCLITEKSVKSVPFPQNIDRDIVQEINQFSLATAGLTSSPCKIDDSLCYLFLPLFTKDSLYQFLVINFDRQYLIDSIMKPRFNAIVPLIEQDNYIVGITKDNTFYPFFFTDPSILGKKLSYDISSPFGLLPSLDNSGDHRHDHFTHDNRIGDKSLHFYRREALAKKMPHLFKPVRLVIGMEQGSLDKAVLHLRIKNMLISFALLGFLVSLIIMIIYLTAKSEWLSSLKLQFIAGLSHELRTPIAVIRSAGENLEKGIIDNNDKSRAYGKLIHNESDKLWTMFETIMLYSGFDSNSRATNIVSTDIPSLINYTLNVKHSDITDKNLDIVLDFPDEVPLADLNESSLSIALRNIVDNAVKFSNSNGKIYITITLVKSPHFIIISVKDEGLGIKKKDLKHIFEPFYRTREVVQQSIAGSGIGLSLVKKICDYNKWTIRVKSRHGYGTEFTLTIPYKQHD